MKRRPPSTKRRGIPVPALINDEWMMWRLIHAGMATIGEMSTPNGWSLAEVMDANLVLDLYDEASAQEQQA